MSEIGKDDEAIWCGEGPLVPEFLRRSVRKRWPQMQEKRKVAFPSFGGRATSRGERKNEEEREKTARTPLSRQRNPARKEDGGN